MSAQVDVQALAAAAPEAQRRYAEFLTAGMKLDLTRGKPCLAQLNLSEAMLALPGDGEHATSEEGDLRNYGGAPKGLHQLRDMFAPLLDVPVDQLVARDNASLALMHLCVASSFFHTVPGGTAPWRPGEVTFLAPSPGYDRHFAICDELGVRLRTVAMTEDGPDMDEVEALVADDPTIKGIWCVPKYSNPTGVTYSDETVRRLATMPTAAADFRIYWDNAYAVHHLEDQHDDLLAILPECEAAGHRDRVFMFASTSKITFPGAGVSFFASSPANVAWFLARDVARSIGPDKLNQLRHLRFFTDTAGVSSHMDAHRMLIAPKFTATIDALDTDLGALGVASWTRPRGGYFISLDVVPGTARRVVELAKAAGVALTPAGATYPGGVDPHDANIRIAPTFPTTADLQQAMAVLTTCVIIAAAEQLL
ncbi:putative aminotransferase [Austwickia sp. TVS 96-490-7B]|uniref:aminotransferase class I/II-fold pyridoxal phosphate-dependent enzyme n=1 Tax=Austwickia sp. TVS 96-490-7B TaxID=2830843 RepID=UPI001C57CE35|nr:aminotransferase class I/II-fold pyridoxal phosphate-dependent enzyme [Austwickia sp. TVS 96-490-7B]MBW3085916.1 putative aminotransferase [Austwickia sp. TVS 96-490-7B]